MAWIPSISGGVVGVGAWAGRKVVGLECYHYRRTLVSSKNGLYLTPTVCVCNTNGQKETAPLYFSLHLKGLFMRSCTSKSTCVEAIAWQPVPRLSLFRNCPAVSVYLRTAEQSKKDVFLTSRESADFNELSIIPHEQNWHEYATGRGRWMGCCDAPDDECLDIGVPLFG